MKRTRDSEEEAADAEEPLSDTEADLEQSAAAERDDDGSTQPPKDTKAKRRILQKKLKKLKQTYESRGRLPCTCVEPS